MSAYQRLDMRQGQSLVMTPQLQQAIKLLHDKAVERRRNERLVPDLVTQRLPRQFFQKKRHTLRPLNQLLNVFGVQTLRSVNRANKLVRL